VSKQRLLRLAFRVPRERAEPFIAELLDFAPSGFEEVEIDRDTVEYALYGPPGELPELPATEAFAAGGRVTVSCSEVDAGWQERWRAFHRPQEVVVPPGLPAVRDRGGRLLDGFWIRPSWAAGPPRPGLAELVIDPGMAFGTGAHPSTKLALQLLLAAAATHDRPPLFDLGCGSGVLSLAAWQLGYKPVHALDNDPVAVAATQANVAAAGAEVRIARWDLHHDPPPTVAGAGVVANLLQSLLLKLARRLTERPAFLVCSGLLAGEGEAVARAFARLGLGPARRAAEAGWEAVILT